MAIALARPDEREVHSHGEGSTVRRLALLASIAAVLVAGTARAADFFVIADTFKSQQDAQTRAATVGGWVLDTDAYSGLGSNLFAVVRGPYANRQAAEQSLKELKSAKGYKAAYVKDGGALRLPSNLAMRSAPTKILLVGPPPRPAERPESSPRAPAAIRAEFRCFPAPARRRPPQSGRFGHRRAAPSAPAGRNPAESARGFRCRPRSRPH